MGYKKAANRPYGKPRGIRSSGLSGRKLFSSEKPVPLANPVSVPFQYFGGKTKLRDKIIEKMPPHETYVEPFAGGASVLLAKPQSEKEVLSDKSSQVMKIHKSLKQHAQKWAMTPSRRKWERIRAKAPSARSPEEEAYLLDHSFNGHGKNFTIRGKRGIFDTSKLHNRLKDVFMYGDDFVVIMRRWDSERTLHYLDPPYVGGGFRYDEHGVTP